MKIHIFLALLSFLFRALSYVISQWKIALVIAVAVMPVGPHIRWEYTYNTVYGQRVFLSCKYLGSRGFITPDFIEGCPVIAILDSREGVRDE